MRTILYSLSLLFMLSADALAASNAEIVANARPSLTRAGTLRFLDPALLVPENAPLLLARLTEGADDTNVRLALIDALPRTGGDWAVAFAELMPAEPDPHVRAMYVFTMKRAPAEVAATVLTAAATDTDVEVRLAAMSTIAGSPAKDALHGALLAGLSDSDSAVRAAAVTGIGVLGLNQGWSGVSALLADEDGAVRLASLHALERLNPAAAAKLPAVAAMKQDRDPRVARAAQALGGTQAGR